jgi:hypothetical protein
MTSAISRVDRAAAETTAGGDIVDAATDMSAAKVQMAASVAVVRASNQMLGTLLDIMA